MPEVTVGVLYLSENVAKLAYNATAPADPFDADADESVVTTAHWIAQRVADDAFRARLWDALCAISGRGGRGLAIGRSRARMVDRTPGEGFAAVSLGHSRRAGDEVNLWLRFASDGETEPQKIAAASGRDVPEF